MKDSLKPANNLIRFYRIFLGAGLLLYLLFTVDLPEDLIYYTYQTNFLCGIWLLMAGLFPSHPFAGKKIQGAPVTYITITALVYNAVLLPMDVAYRGYLSFNSILTHMLIPLLMILDYLFVQSITAIQWRSLIYWMCYPIAYLILILGMGRLTTFYPYPFIDPSVVQNTSVLIRNYIILLLLHAVIAAIAIATARAKTKPNLT